MGSHGDVNPYLTLGRELKRRGHSIVLAAPYQYAAEAAREGIEFVAIRPDIDIDDPTLLPKILDPRAGSAYVISQLVMPALNETYLDLERACEGADLLLTHFLVFAGPILAEKKGLPWMNVVLQPIALMSAYDPPIMAPAPWLRALRPLGPGFHKLLLGQLRKFSHPWGEPVRAFRRRLGLGPGEDPIFTGQHSPHGVLVLFSRALAAPQPDWPLHAHQCGFPFLDEDLGGATGLDQRLEEFLAAGEPPVVFTLGSTAVRMASDFYRLAAGLGRRAVLLSGKAELGVLPPHVLALPSAPYFRLFPRAGAIVHSGGIGTTAQALRSGRPQLVVPFAHDQFDNAGRVERLRCGRWLPFARVSPGRLARRLQRLPSDGCAEVARVIAGEDGVQTACDRIEERWRAK